MWTETMAKSLTDGVILSIEAKTGMKLDHLRTLKDEVIEDAGTFAAKKAAQATQTAFIAAAKKAGVPTEGQTNEQIKMSLEEKGGILAILALLLLKIATMAKRWYDVKNGRFQPVEVVKGTIPPPVVVNATSTGGGGGI
jgi:cell division protein FtsW (lipid II flippase)